MPKDSRDREEHQSLEDQPLISLVSKPKQPMPSKDGRESQAKKQKQSTDEPGPKVKKPRKSSDESTNDGAHGSTGSAQGENPLRRAAVREAFARLVVARLHGRPDPF